MHRGLHPGLHLGFILFGGSFKVRLDCTLDCTVALFSCMVHLRYAINCTMDFFEIVLLSKETQKYEETELKTDSRNLTLG